MVFFMQNIVLSIHICVYMIFEIIEITTSCMCCSVMLFTVCLVLVDTSDPLAGQVVDGKEAGFSDVQYTTSRARVEVQWRGFSDPESAIRNYQVQVYRAR